MSTNFSIGNETWWRRNNSPVYFYPKYSTDSIIVNTTFAVTGTLINVWFLAAMLLSQEIRVRIRNKIICGMLVVNLTETLLLCPFMIVRSAAFLINPYYMLDCHIYTVYIIIFHIQDFVSNWYILFLLCIYASRTVNFEPKFTPLWNKIFTVILFMSPCVFALLLVPLTMKSYSRRYSDNSCMIRTSSAVKVFKSLDTVVPQALASLILVVTAILKHRQYPYARFSTFRAQLIDDRSQVDPWSPFVALLVAAIATDFSFMLIYMNPGLISRVSFRNRPSVYTFVSVLTYLRLIILPLVLLLFPDIRERIKTWRPCRQSAPPPAGLVVTYEKNAA